ncbi:MAG: hypothetical protein EXS05_22105 [Planctomycetaceae bacterium]|nr:hypothetical protein [Planctomycetaceae bacterium]
MANEKLDNELEAIAFEIYKQTVSHGSAIANERQAIDAFAKADTFIAVRERARAGKLEIKKPVGKQLADCSAPNLPETHPHNIVSQRFGSLEKVLRIKKWLDENPPTEDQTYLIPKVNRAFDLSWKVPELNLARTIFHEYVN